MNRFLWGGGGFNGIVNDFGRPVVNHWTGVATLRGAAAEAHAATRVRTLIPEGVDLPSFVDRETAALKSHVDGAYAVALAIDPLRWELLRFTLWEEIPAGEPGDRYAVLHLSTAGDPHE
jgi:hypothetical protein